MTSNRLTRAQVEDFLSKHKTKEAALEVLQDAGIVDEQGNLTPPYRPCTPDRENESAPV